MSSSTWYTMFILSSVPTLHDPTESYSVCCSTHRPSTCDNVGVCVFMAMVYATNLYYGTHLTSPYDQFVCIISMTSWLMINGLFGFFSIVQYAMFAAYYDGQMVRNITKRSLTLSLILHTITLVMWTTIGWIVFISYPSMIALVTARFYETFMLVFHCFQSVSSLILSIVSYSLYSNL